jgi:predicted lipoprotein with Yx(FWY)xxD motif
MQRKFGWLAGALALTVALAACGGGDSNSSSKVQSKATTTTAAPAVTTTTGGAATTTTSASTTTTPPAAAATVKAATVSLGNVVVSSDGKTLYAYMPDGTGTTAMCTGGCAGAWPPLMVSGQPVAGSGIDASKLSKAPSGQVTYGGHLLYNYSADTAPGQTNGQGLGNVWHVVSPSGDIIS